MARASDGTDMPVSTLPASLNVGSPNMVLFLTLKGQDTDDASLSNSTVACVSFYLLLLTIRIACMTISTRRPTKKIHLPGSASPPQVAQSFRQASVSSCPS